MDDISETPLACSLRKLRNDDYNNAKATVSHALSLGQYLDVFKLKAFLIRATKDKWGETKEADIVLMALGLLDGYYYNTKYIEEVNQSNVAKIGDRRDKYLRCGPYVRTKDGKRYASYDGISDKEKRAVKNALGQQDGRLINELAGFIYEIYEIDDIKQYIANAEIDPRYIIKRTTKTGRRRRSVRLPKQCSFLDDFPEPSEHSTPAEVSEAKASHSTFPPVKKLLLPDEDITLCPGEPFHLDVAILPKESADAPLSFVSLDPSIVTVSQNGMLKAQEKPQKLSHSIKKSQFLCGILDNKKDIDTDYHEVEIIIQAESGITASKVVTVDYSRKRHEPTLVSDINDFVPGFSIAQKVRLVGDKKWEYYVHAKVGDRVEIQAGYCNTSLSSALHENVMMRAVLPADLKYVPGSTILYNGTYPEGAKASQDTLATTGVNIGGYELNANAYVRFTAEVTDTNLKSGSNTLFSWMRGTVNGVVLQDHI